MSDGWTQYKPKLALYDVLSGGGISVDVAMKRAELQMDSHRAQAMAALASSVQALEAAVRAGGAGRPDLIYTLSVDVLDVAGLYHPTLCRAANSLCDLTQRLEAAARWDWPSVGVHVSAMRLMLDRTGEGDPALQAVLQGLAAVVAKYPEPGPESPASAA